MVDYRRIINTSLDEMAGWAKGSDERGRLHIQMFEEGKEKVDADFLIERRAYSNGLRDARSILLRRLACHETEDYEPDNQT